MRKWIKALAAGALASLPAAALAAIDNTHHDVPYLTAGATTEKCAYCHSRTSIAPQAAFGKVGGFCIAVCHIDQSGISGARGNVVPMSPGIMNYTAGAYTAVGATALATGIDAIANGHAMTKSNLNGITWGGAEVASVTAVGWPYTGGADLQCTSCHAVHDASNPPFLNAKLSDGSQGQGFCQRCHTNAVRQQAFATSGNHPIEFPWEPIAAAARTGAKASEATTWMGGRELMTTTAVSGLITNVPATGVNADGTGSLDGLAASWNLGGHIINPATGLPTDGANAGNVGCYSCHAVHATQSATGLGGDKLLVGDSMVTACFACHSHEPGTTGYGHPINPEVPMVIGTVSAWGAAPLTATYTAINPALYRPNDVTSAPYCVSCHQVHGGRGGRMAIRANAGTDLTGAADLLPALNTDGSVCEMCHAASYTNPVAANKHHPGGAATYVPSGFAAQLGWITRDGHGDLDDGLSCPDCHVGDGTINKRSSAHNWQ